MTSKPHPSGTPVTPCGKPKLLDRVRHEIRVRHMARSTERLYVNWIRRFILFHHKRHPVEMGKAEVSAFLTHLAVEGQVASSTQNQALTYCAEVMRALTVFHSTPPGLASSVTNRPHTPATNPVHWFQNLPFRPSPFHA